MIKYVYLLKPPLLDCEPPTGPRGRPRSAPRGPRPTARSGRRPPDHSTGTRARGAEMQAETTSAVSSESDDIRMRSQFSEIHTLRQFKNGWSQSGLYAADRIYGQESSGLTRAPIQ